MGKFDDLSNDELAKLIKEMEITHTNIRVKMLKDFDNLEIVEREYEKVKNILNKRFNNE